MDVPPAEVSDEEKQPRTLQTLKDDLSAFLAAGSRLSLAKTYNNVIRAPILPVEISHAILPVLHPDLGIYSWIYEAMLAEVRQLDKSLISKTPASTTDSTQSTALAALHAKLQHCTVEAEAAIQKATTIQGHLSCVALHGHEQGVTGHNLEVVCDQIQQDWQAALRAQTDAAQQLKSVQQQFDKESGGKSVAGPCERSVEAALQAAKMMRQAYHGGAFVGNHVHQGLKEPSSNNITSAPVAIIEARCPNLLADTQALRTRFYNLFHGYSKCSVAFGDFRTVSSAYMMCTYCAQT